MGVLEHVAAVPKVKGIGKRTVSGGRATKKIAKNIADGKQQFQVDPKLVEKYRTVRQADRKREAFNKIREQNKDAKRARRTSRKLERKQLGKDAAVKAVPKTKERLRRSDITVVDDVADPEILADEADDEYAPHFRQTKRLPRVLITTCKRPSKRTKLFAKELKALLPNAAFRPRKDYTVKEITGFCKNRKFTDLIVIAERLKQPYQMILSHLPEGPTATFRISNFLPHSEIEGAGERTAHYPELNLKNFDTRLGRRVARMLEALFPTKRDYEGRAICTAHNQRDYIFVRVHRYIFDGMNDVTIQEMGPRFTLRLYSLQRGTYDLTGGEFEWYRKKVHDNDKLEWYL